MTARIEVQGLQVAAELYDFINGKALPGTGVDQDRFWEQMSAIVHDLCAEEPRASGQTRCAPGKDRRLASRQPRCAGHGRL